MTRPWDNVPRTRLACLPTPLHDARNLSKLLGGPRILIKRDDLNEGIGIAGNKVRKCEFLFADALAQGADTVITTGAQQSNHARAVAACARRLGMDALLVLTGDDQPDRQGNLLLDDLLQVKTVTFNIPSYDAALVEAEMQRIAGELRDAGAKPYIIPMGGSNDIGGIGYAAAVGELSDQLSSLGIKKIKLFNATGSWGTNAGLLVGIRALALDWEMIGVSVNWSTEEHRQGVSKLATQTAAKLGLDFAFTPEDVKILGGYIGPRYGSVTPECREAVAILARTEAILLDPVYTGKAMAGLIDQIRRGEVTGDDTVVFIHTGGTPALFAYKDALTTEDGPS